jgi:hypothetical protein
VDIAAADAMAQLSAGAPQPATAPALAHPFAGWAPGPGMGMGALPNTSLPAAVPALPVPEPAGWLMFVIGATGVVLYSRFRK